MKRILLVFAVMMSAFLELSASSVVLAAEGYEICDDSNATAEIKNSAGCSGKSRDSDKLEDNVQKVLNWVFFVVGALATIMVIYGGIRYTISAGDSSKVTTAKHTIMYSIVGLIVALLGAAIVNFVIANVWK